MLRSYLKIALRNFLRHKGYSFINLTGLAVGIACCTLMLLYVQNELSYDKHHPNAERIYRVIGEENNEGQIRRLASTYAPLAPGLLADFPDIQRAVRLFPKSVVVARSGKERFQEELFFFADSTFFSLFVSFFAGRS